MASFTDTGKEWEALVTMDQRMCWKLEDTVWMGLELQAGDVVRMPEGGVRPGHIPEVVCRMSRIPCSPNLRAPPEPVILRSGTAHDWVDGWEPSSPASVVIVSPPVDHILREIEDLRERNRRQAEIVFALREELHQSNDPVFLRVSLKQAERERDLWKRKAEENDLNG